MDEEPEIIDDWERERVLGCGGFGVVSLWRNNKTDEKIAIKKYRGDNDNLTQKHRDRWTQEVEMMKRIDNENIVSFRKLPPKFEEKLNKYNPSKLPMLSMEFCTQGDLRSVLTQSENCCGLPESDVRYILNDLMNAVSYLHTLKITHRDLKPENIVLQSSDRPNGIIYKLIDLGYAKELDAQSICASFVGTLQYLAPELLYSKHYSCSVDYWSMGLVAFEIICGTRPFLPNKSPAQWMFHVHKKSSETICIYQQNKNEDSIKSSTEIFPENHVSSCFKREIEKWLQLALEYNPRQRGYINYDPEKTNNELAIFTSLKALLEKKIITVFLVQTSEFCSYEIDDCTLVSTLQGWIERDSKILKSEQMLLSEKCDCIDLDALAIQFFDKTYSQPMLYVFKKNDILSLDIKPKHIPELVEKILHDASEELQYYFQKRAYAHALYFIFKETNLYNTILDACNLKIKNIIKICDQTSHVCRNMNISIEKLIAQQEFSKEVLDFDCKQYLKNYSQTANHWNETFNAIMEKIQILHKVCNQITTRHESVYRRTSTLSVYWNKEFSKHNNHELNEKLDEALEIYRKLRRRSKESRSQPESCINMARILYQVLKSRDKLLRDTVFRKYLQVIIDIDNELLKIQVPLNSTIEHIEKYRQELLSDHIERQTKIWDFTIKHKQKTKNQNVNKSNFIVGNSKITNSDYGTPISLDKPLHFILGESKHNSSLESNASYHSLSSSNSPVPPKNESNSENTLQNGVSIETNKNIVINTLNSPNNNENVKISIQMPNFAIGEPTSVMINYNLSLRHELAEKTLQSFKQYKSILSEPLDFSFLEEEI